VEAANQAYLTGLLAKNQDEKPVDMAKVNALVQAQQEEERSGNLASIIWNASISTLGSILSPGKYSSGKPLYSPRQDDGLAGGDKNVGYKFSHPDESSDVVVETLNYWGQYKTINLSNLPNHPKSTNITAALDEYEDLSNERVGKKEEIWSNLAGLGLSMLALGALTFVTLSTFPVPTAYVAGAAIIPSALSVVSSAQNLAGNLTDMTEINGKLSENWNLIETIP